jgi:hypothetical protein
MREAYFVAREQDVIVSQEALAEDIRECVVFFVEVKDAGVGCACFGRSATACKGEYDHEHSRVSSFISTFFSSSCRRKDSKLQASQWLQMW